MARPSSSISSAIPGAPDDPGDGGASDRGLFGFLERGGARDAVSDRSWLAAMLAFEAALARAEAGAGIVPADAAEAIARCCRAERFDAASIGREAARTGNPAAPLVAALTSAVAEASGDAAAGYVHLGATSQDVMDTASMLVVRDGCAALLTDLRLAADAAGRCAETHRGTLMLGRTLLQAALPTTFGAVAAAWLVGLDRATEAIETALEHGLAVQLGGAAGTLASLGDRGPRVVELLAAELGLAAPLGPWHTERTRIAETAAALGIAAGAIGKVALDVVLLSQTEIGEVREGTQGSGGSSTLPQKRNPVAAVSARACAARAPGLVATMLAAMPQELQRGAGPWHAEWQTLSALLVSAGSAAAWIAESLGSLEVDATRMRANLDATGGFALAERVTTALAPSLGRGTAHRLVEGVANGALRNGRPFAGALAEDREIAAHLSPDEIAGLLDPAGYLGAAGLFVDRALEAHRLAGGRRR